MLSCCAFNPFHPLASDVKKNSEHLAFSFCSRASVRGGGNFHMDVACKFWTEYISHRFSIFYRLSQEVSVLVPPNLLADGTSSFSHYIICFYFLSSVTVRQPIRIIKTTFIQFAAEFQIFLAWALFPMHRCGTSTRERGPDSISLQLFIWEKIWVVRLVMELLPNLFIHVSVIQTNMCSAIVGVNFGSCYSLSTQ